MTEIIYHINPEGVYMLFVIVDRDHVSDQNLKNMDGPIMPSSLYVEKQSNTSKRLCLKRSRKKTQYLSLIQASPLSLFHNYVTNKPMTV